MRWETRNTYEERILSCVKVAEQTLGGVTARLVACCGSFSRLPRVHVRCILSESRLPFPSSN